MAHNGEKTCYCCGKPFRGSARYFVSCEDDQDVFVGPDCYRQIIAAGNAGYRHPKCGLTLYPFNGRFVVEFERNGAVSNVEKDFPAFHLAARFARKVTKDGTAWPAVAFVNCEVRESQYDAWQPHRRMRLVEIIDGEMQ